MINTEEKQTYASPRVKTVEISAQAIICESGNESMEEVDLGDGGFTEQ
ncbi:MAG: hypothetical protein MJY91_05585 [Bacteroidales bacterium]|nr:hypothetical protein [Bacteroidales bacterium]